MRAGKTDGVAAPATREERLFFRCAGDDGELASGARVDVVVVETLGDQDEVCDAEVDGESDHSRHEVRPDSSWNRLIYARDQH